MCWVWYVVADGCVQDHYVNVPVDLSQVLFICTSNTLETIAAPLLDRCEVVHLSGASFTGGSSRNLSHVCAYIGYTYNEKMHIARRFLLPKQLQANGLTADHVSLSDPVLMHIATHYTREAGVRSLERAIGAVIRYKAVEWAEYCDSVGMDPNASFSEVSAQQTGDSLQYRQAVEEHELEKVLGIARWDEDEREREERRGLVYGLVVTGMGEGGVLPVETIMVPGTGKLKLTGSLGDVIKESGELALSWVKRHAYDLYITKTRAQDPLKNPDPVDVHLHLPSRAVRKDGPSAGIAMASLSCLLFCVLQLIGRVVDVCVRLAPHRRVCPEQHRHDGRGHPPRARGRRRRDQGEGARRAPCAGHQAHPAVGEPQGCRTRRSKRGARRDADRVRAHGRGGARGCLREGSHRLAAERCPCREQALKL